MWLPQGQAWYGHVLVSTVPGSMSMVLGSFLSCVLSVPLFLLRAQKLLTAMFPGKHESSLLKSILVVTKPTGHDL